jgi:hypothetical protein
LITLSLHMDQKGHQYFHSPKSHSMPP